MAFAAVFPGQGSQSTGMLADLAENFAQVEETFQQGSDVIGKDLWALCQAEENADLLNQTENTQPVMLAAGVAVWRVWQSQGGCMPVGMAGHSLGEYSALVAANVINFEDAISLVASRAGLMQQAVAEGEGAMAAILGLDDDVIVKLCADAAGENGGVVEAVNFNSPGQVVIAGNAGAVDDAIALLNDAGAKKSIKLSVSVPSHCSLMQDAAQKLGEKLAKIQFNDGDLSVLQNVSASVADNKQQALQEQLYKPVRWVETINNLEQQGADSIIEFGPGKVLFGLNRRINRKLGNICVHDSATLEKALQTCG